MQLGIALLTLFISLVTALILYLKNPRSGTHVYFAILIFFISVYPVFNFLTINSSTDEQALFWSKMILLVSIPQGPLLYFFAKTFPSAHFIFHKKLQVIITLWLVLNIAFATLGLIFQTVSVSDGIVNIQPGPLVPSFGLLHASTIVAGLAVLFKKYRKSSVKDRQQLSYVFYGILISFSLTFLITFILPIILKNTILLSISPVFLALAVISVAYAIVAKHLFDVKLIVARAIAYTMLLSSLVGLYALAVYVLTSELLGGNSAFAQRVVPILAAIFLVFTAPFFKLLFDRITNKIFYRDAYDPEAFLDELNKTIVSNIELGILLRHTTDVIQRNIKAEHCFVEVLPSANRQNRVIGIGSLSLGRKDSAYIFGNLDKSGNKLLAADELSYEHSKLRLLLSENNIGVIVRLAAGNDYKNTIAYLIVGTKKSGNIYTKQDINIIKIIADELVIAIQNSLRFEEIQEFNITLQAKVNEATAKLQKTNKKLRDLDETKDEFISMASHQLRTPLTSVKGYMSMVLEGDAGKLSKPQTELLNQAFTSSQRMVYLIADLLNVSRLKTGKFVIDAQPTNLADLVQGEIMQLKQTAKAKRITFKYIKPKDFPKLMLDETKVRQVVMNFADNAIYYTPPGGQIEINLKEDKNHVYFLVKDNGLGVPEAEKAHLFTKFYRAKNARKARPDGTGLGLFMAKKVVDAQGGHVIFDSEEGKGSTFGFTFEKHKLRTGQPAAKQS